MGEATFNVKSYNLILIRRDTNTAVGVVGVINRKSYTRKACDTAHNDLQMPWRFAYMYKAEIESGHTDASVKIVEASSVRQIGITRYMWEDMELPLREYSHISTTDSRANSRYCVEIHNPLTDQVIRLLDLVEIVYRLDAVPQFDGTYNQCDILERRETYTSQRHALRAQREYMLAQANLAEHAGSLFEHTVARIVPAKKYVGRECNSGDWAVALYGNDGAFIKYLPIGRNRQITVTRSTAYKHAASYNNANIQLDGITASAVLYIDVDRIRIREWSILVHATTDGNKYEYIGDYVVCSQSRFYTAQCCNAHIKRLLSVREVVTVMEGVETKVRPRMYKMITFTTQHERAFAPEELTHSHTVGIRRDGGLKLSRKNVLVLT